MKCSAFFLAAVVVAISSFGQSKPLNKDLKARLDSIGNEDQRYRIVLDKISSHTTDSLAALYKIPSDSVYAYLWRKQNAIDTWCIGQVEAIIKRYGYPGKTLVGTPTNTAAFYVIQHSATISRYLPLLKTSAEKGEIQYELVAMMEDRLLVQQEKEQIYGTQLWANKLVRDSATGAMKPYYYFNPIKDVARINERRKKAGLNTIEEYAAEMGIPFRVKKPDWWK